MRAIADVVTGFRMPGHSIPGFSAAATIALGGVYNLRIHHEDVLRPMLRHLKVLQPTGFRPEGQATQQEIGVFLATLNAQARTQQERREAVLARRAAKSAQY